ncbi:hypothetical protein [Streptomyces beijiangensis]|uniref:Uncharacterized protein n=1 Tax=Streptomyces beijiangensis TaxID=163361 RepID=A0A939FDM3_9ACTN|nr:hypothetical protein [Streptomyces beijiangensis]MBO0516266.1 hypothetical protein [Streptomyces beijiangensis]
MNREELLNSRRWKVAYTYTCGCDPQCYWTKVPGLDSNETYLNNGEEVMGATAATTIVAKKFRHAGVTDARIWQESAEERDARLASDLRRRDDEGRGSHWAMGGAN